MKQENKPLINSRKTKTTSQSRITFKDKKGSASAYTLNNPHKLVIEFIKSDGDLYESSTGPKRCDFSIFSNEAKTMVLLELKGRDFRKAIEQVKNTLEDYKGKYGYTRYYARIVLTKCRVPNLPDNDIKSLRKELREMHGDFDFKSRLLEEEIQEDFSLKRVN